MTGLRTPTALFLALTLLPAGLLGWLGWRASLPLVDELRRGAREAAQRTAAEVGSAMPQRIAMHEAELDERLRAGAAVLWQRLPNEPPGLVLRTVEAGLPGALVLTTVGGYSLLPAGPNSNAPSWLPEWSQFEQLRAAGERATAVQEELVERAAALAAPALRAAALASALGSEPEAAVVHLARLPASVLAAAGPRPFEVLRHSARGRAVLASAHGDGWLYAASATEQGRLVWLAAAGASVAECDAQRLRERRERGLSLLTTTAELANGCCLSLLRDPAAALAGLSVGTRDDDCAVDLALAAAPGERVATPAEDAAATIQAAAEVATAWGLVRVSVRHLGLPKLEAHAARQRWLTGIGIVLLLVSMLAGLALVRRALLRERQARQLRDDFIANVSHELKTPLTSLRLHADMLAADAIDGETRRHYGEVVQAEGARLSALVDDLLDFAALERGRRRLEPEPVDLTAALRAAHATWSARAEQDGVQFTCQGATEVAALVDPIALQRVLTNLLQNAFRHGRPARDGGPSRIRLLAGPGPCLEVRDNGPGIAAPDRERIFARFERGADGREGSGIGLALSRELTTACGGRLSCGDDGAETLFCLELPDVPDMPDVPDVPRAADVPEPELPQ